MNYFFIEPEVGGGVGPNTILDRRTDPPRVDHLNYEFDVWLGDCLVEGFPCLIATQQASNALEAAGATGFDLGDVEISTTYEFDSREPSVRLPPFVWLKVIGIAGKDDFGVGADLRFVISERALDIVRPFGLKHADIEPFSAREQ